MPFAGKQLGDNAGKVTWLGEGLAVDIQHHITRSSRRATVAVVLGLSLLTAACGSSSSSSHAASSKAILNASVAYYPGALTSVPAFIAEAEGFFAKNGLKVDLVPVPNGGAMTAAVVSGSVDFVNNSYDNLEEAISKGLPVRAVVGNTVNAPFALVARAGTPLPHLKEGYPKVIGDLLHTNWGVIELGVSTQFIDEEILGGAGYPTNSVTYVAVGLPTTALPALLRGSVTTYLSFDPMTAIVVDHNEGTVVVNFLKGQGPADFRNVNYNGWWANTNLIKTQPTLVDRFVKANEEAYCWYSNPTNLPHVISIIKKYVPVPQLTAAQYATMIREDIASYGVDINSSSIAAWNHLLDSNRILSHPFSRSALVTSTAPSNYQCR